MIYLELFLGFLKVGFFAFGGAYGAIPLIREIVLSYGWLNDDTLSYMIAVSESTPGPIMVNLATYVGSSQAGIWGAVLATIAVVLPSFVVILLVMAVLKNVIKNRYVQAALGGLKPCIIGIILATGCYMIFHNCLAGLAAGTLSETASAGAETLAGPAAGTLSETASAGAETLAGPAAETLAGTATAAAGAGNFGSLAGLASFRPDPLRIAFTAALLLVYYGSRKFLKKKLSPIMLIVISACAGAFVF